MNEAAYLDFLRGKISLARQRGHEVPAADINPLLKPHQRDIVQWATRGGQRAIFAAFGLGKTPMQIEILRLLAQTEPGGGPMLIVLPLGVRQEFIRDGAMIGEHWARETGATGWRGMAARQDRQSQGAQRLS